MTIEIEAVLRSGVTGAAPGLRPAVSKVIE